MAAAAGLGVAGVHGTVRRPEAGKMAAARGLGLGLHGREGKVMERERPASWGSSCPRRGGPRREEGSAATAAWRGSAAHCGDSEEGDDHLAKTPRQPFL